MSWGRILEVGSTSWWFWGQANLSLSLAVPLKTLLSDLRQLSLCLSFLYDAGDRAPVSEEAGGVTMHVACWARCLIWSKHSVRGSSHTCGVFSWGAVHTLCRGAGLQLTSS